MILSNLKKQQNESNSTEISIEDNIDDKVEEKQDGKVKENEGEGSTSESAV